jgi:hypothetical protein
MVGAMSSEWHQVGFFAAGLAIGAVAAAMIVLGPYSPARAKQARAPVAVAAAVRTAECPQEAVATVAGIKDGRYRMPADLSGYASTDPQVFMVMGNEAAAAGRVHDAEVAYLMACRVADQYKGAGSAASADARYELARHYGNLANAPGPAAANCGELLLRAEAMYADSLQLFRVNGSAPPEKLRLAEQGLAGVRQMAMAQAGVPPASPGAPAAAPALQRAGEVNAAPAQSSPPAHEAASAAPEPPVARARPPVPPRPQQARPAATRKVAIQSRSTSHCAGARTRADRLICSDAELARMDREMGYLQARARNAWRYEDQWRRSEASCQDRACLLRVFATKRSQLVADINSA